MEYKPKDTTIIISDKQIIRITRNNLIFLSHKNETKSIDFGKCNKNWIEQTMCDQANGDHSVSNSKCVAVRDILGAPPWIEFFAEPRIRVLFPPKYPLLSRIAPKHFRGNYQAFRETAQKVTVMGWTTYDLS